MTYKDVSVFKDYIPALHWVADRRPDRDGFITAVCGRKIWSSPLLSGQSSVIVADGRGQVTCPACKVFLNG